MDCAQGTGRKRSAIIKAACWMLLVLPGLAASVARAADVGAEASEGNWLMVAFFAAFAIVIGLVFHFRSESMGFTARTSLLIGALVIIISVLAGMSVFDMSAIGTEIGEVSESDVPLSNALSEIASDQIEQALWLERAAIAGGLSQTLDQQRLAETVSQYDQLTGRVRDALDTARRIATEGARSSDPVKRAKHEGILRQLDAIEAEHEGYTRNGARLFALIRDGRTADAVAGMADVERTEDALDQQLGRLDMQLMKSTADAAATVDRHEKASLQALAILGAVGVVFAILLSLVVIRGVGGVLRALGTEPAQLSEIAAMLARGRLDIDVSGATTGVHLAIADTIGKLRDIMGSIISGAEVVNQAAEEVAQGNTNLSQRTQEQASNLEEVAASMEEMTATVNQNAENAVRATRYAEAARDQAVEGGQVVERSIAAVEEINASSKRIADIIGVIDEIAFQTNLLALNAAVEAARAGEQGRGFAVVASEVRSLAGRSATAAREIKGLIQDSVGKVEEGAKLVDESGAALGRIVASVREVSQIVAEISAASQEQSSGISQVNLAVTQMDEMTQQNAALVEESAAAAEAMGSEADQLRNTIAYFRIGEQEERRARAGGGDRARASHRSRPDATARLQTAGGEGPPSRRLLAATETESGGDGDWREF